MIHMIFGSLFITRSQLLHKMLCKTFAFDTGQELQISCRQEKEGKVQKTVQLSDSLLAM